MPEMNDAERRKFLLDGTKTGKLATVRKDGSPHVVPVWYDLDGDSLVFTTGAETVKGRNIKREPRVCMAVDDQAPPYSFVMIEGTAELSEDPEELYHWAKRIAARYMGQAKAEAFGKRNSGEGEVLVRITPSKIISYRDVTA
ncbi:MAG: PPOX class F420-dependent oxidoreductase [Candidatus Dadabacteria bacterium]|nr:PPOX class F420-dependent oxidoreductase [Candidatus Dadabacteria bacterium]